MAENENKKEEKIENEELQNEVVPKQEIGRAHV